VRRLRNPAGAPALGLTPWRTWGCPTDCKIPLSKVWCLRFVLIRQGLSFFNLVNSYGHYVVSYAADPLA